MTKRRDKRYERGAGFPEFMPENLPKPLILVVDDMIEIAHALRLFLESAGWEVAMAHDGPEALTMARERLPDVVITDINLPTIQGWELCDKLKAMARHKPLPVFMLTARTGEMDEVRSFESSADEHFVKPPDFQALVAAVARHLKAIGKA